MYECRSLCAARVQHARAALLAGSRHNDVPAFLWQYVAWRLMSWVVFNEFQEWGLQGPAAGHGAGGGTGRVGPTRAPLSLSGPVCGASPSLSPPVPCFSQHCTVRKAFISVVAGLPPLTWTLSAAAERVWHVSGSLGSLQVIKHLQHLFFPKIEVAVAIGRIWSAASATGEELVLEEITSQPGSLLHPPRLIHVLCAWLM